MAKGYRERHLPADVLVVDWFYYTKMGQMDMDPAKWPDPAAMNKQLHAMGFHTMISVWPRFVPEDRYYDDGAEERVVRAPGRRHADEWAAVRPRGLGHRHDQSRGGSVVLGHDSREHREQRVRFVLGG